MSYSNSNNVFKNSNAIRVYCVEKPNHAGDRSNVYDDNRHCDDNGGDDVLGSCSDTYKEWRTECHNMMFDDQMLYENSKDSRADMCENCEREKNIERKNVRSVHKKVRSKVNNGNG